ncbi:hypothetical protein CDL15_Pgr015641 [Punica granatum]|uniref:Carotenoid 9,10(9',10')-cleavage dioxygenase 1-like n=1 Tax=Punica granatum TaxID=22663 RepID=A0A218XPQ2_PUNGR|nr:hypothetical protein CDL15_Pgr015641 [Punica granatum]
MAMASSSSSCCSSYPSHMAFLQAKCCVQRRPTSFSQDFDNFKVALSSAFKPLMKELQRRHPLRIEVPAPVKETYRKILDTFVNSVFEFVDQPLLPSQSNFLPVEELGKPVLISSIDIEGKIPDDFPEGVYIRNGPNPLFGGLKSTRSVFGRSSHAWIEGEGMLHALYFNKQPKQGYGDGMGFDWSVQYNNRHVETGTFNLERKRTKPSFLPAIEGDSLAVLSAYLLNSLRFGKVNKYISNTNVFEHAGKYYSVAENHIPQEIDISTLGTLGDWDMNGAWNRPFTSHPKRAPGTGELVIIGIDAIKPFMELGIVSADGRRLLHKVDIKLNRCSLCHEIGVTQRYNVIMDFPVTIDIYRLLLGGPLIKFNKESYARIGVMPRYGDSDSIQWFNVELSCAFHIFNCFEDADEVVVRGCRAQESIIPGPNVGLNNSKRFSRRPKPLRVSDRENVNSNSIAEEEEKEAGFLFSRTYEWRLNMKTGDVKERNVTGKEFSVDFPIINGNFTGLRNKFGYAQVVDSSASSKAGPVKIKYGCLSKLYFDEPNDNGDKFSPGSGRCEDAIKVEYHDFGGNIFCSGATFVPRQGGLEEDDGWLITFVHNERTDISQVHIIDCKNVSGEPVAKITLPSRVPYGFHGTYIPRI